MSIALLPLGSLKPNTPFPNGPLYPDSPDGYYRSLRRTGPLNNYAVFCKRGTLLTSDNWAAGWPGERLRGSTYFDCEYLGPLEDA